MSTAEGTVLFKFFITFCVFGVGRVAPGWGRGGGVVSLRRLFCGFQRSNSGHKAWSQALLSSESLLANNFLFQHVGEAVGDSLAFIESTTCGLHGELVEGETSDLE